jgi:hypothetical protein
MCEKPRLAKRLPIRSLKIARVLSASQALQLASDSMQDVAQRSGREFTLTISPPTALRGARGRSDSAAAPG